MHEHAPVRMHASSLHSYPPWNDDKPADVDENKPAGPGPEETHVQIASESSKSDVQDALSPY